MGLFVFSISGQLPMLEAEMEKLFTVLSLSHYLLTHTHTTASFSISPLEDTDDNSVECLGI